VKQGRGKLCGGPRRSRELPKRARATAHRDLTGRDSLRLFIVPTLSLVLLVAGCDEWGGDEARNRLHLPPFGLEGEPQAGRNLYLAHCSECHGEHGLGSDRGPPLVHKTYRPSHHPDEAFHLAVAQGVKQHHWQYGDMPPIDGLAPEQVAHIAAFIRQQQRRAGIYRE